MRRAEVPQSLAHGALMVRDNDETIAFYVETLGFARVEGSDQPEQD